MTFCKQTAQSPSPSMRGSLNLDSVLVSSSIERIPYAELRRLHRRQHVQLVQSLRSNPLHDGSRRSPRRLCCDATRREGHHGLANIQRFGLGFEKDDEFRFLPEVQDPHLRGGGGGWNSGIPGRCVSCDKTAQACIPPAVRACPCGHADAACRGIQHWGAILGSVEEMIVGGFDIRL
jgi:hypothetical protein